MKFRKRSNCGVLVGCDQEQEWLLPWWWGNYTRHNAQPVAFADFGMSPEARNWCQERGELLTHIDFPIAPKGQAPKQRAELWESSYGEIIWRARQAWFKKPHAMLQTPFTKTLWLDLDCEVMGSIEPLFAYVREPSGMAMTREPLLCQERRRREGELLPQEVWYNSGVIAFSQDSPLLSLWADAAIAQNACFSGDQDLLSRIIHLEGIAIDELPPLYNWQGYQERNVSALIIHWLGVQGKEFIKAHGGLTPHLGDLHLMVLDSLERGNCDA